jgi:hypothetical protein
MLGHAGQAIALARRALLRAPADPDVLAVAAAVDEALGRRAAALEKIAAALAAGYPRWVVERDPTFAALRQDARFGALADGTGAPGRAERVQ